MSRITLVVKTYGEMDPIQLAWMVDQMESYKLRCRALGVPVAGTVFLGAVALAVHLVHQRHKRLGSGSCAGKWRCRIRHAKKAPANSDIGRG